MSDNDFSALYFKANNKGVQEKIDKIFDAIQSIQAYLRKVKEGDYEIEEREGTTETHSKGAADGVGGLEAAVQDRIEKFLKEDLTPEAKAKVEELKDLIEEYMTVDDNVENKDKAIDIKQELMRKLEDSIWELQDMSEKTSFYEIDDGRTITEFTIEDLHKEKMPVIPKKAKKQFKFDVDIELKMDDGGGDDFSDAPAKEIKPPKVVKLKSKRITGVKIKEVKMTKSPKIKGFETPNTKASTPEFSIDRRERIEALERWHKSQMEAIERKRERQRKLYEEKKRKLLEGL